MKRTHQRILRLPMEKRAEMALREAVDEVIGEHARILGKEFSCEGGFAHPVRSSDDVEFHEALSYRVLSSCLERYDDLL